MSRAGGGSRVREARGNRGHPSVQQLNIVSAAAARSAIARCILGDDTSQTMRVGAITLYPHQTSAVRRIRRALRDFGGALLCDTVGLGKTYTALAAAAIYQYPLILAPAVLEPMWRQALDCTGVSADFTSVEALSRGKTMERSYPLIIVDEAHHLRNPATRRYAEVAHLCTTSPVLLVSATPIHNSRGDLASLAALFMGHRAHSLDDAGLSRLVVRRATVSRETSLAAATGATDATVAAIPHVDHAPSRVIVTDDTVLDRIAALPPPVPPVDGGNATTLVTQGLARQWVSSSAALLGAIKRRIARSHALIAALDAGRYPTRAELEHWVYADDSLQLAFPELLPPSDFVAPQLLDAVTAHLEGLRSLARHASSKRGEDELRADFVRGVIDAHTGEKVVVFTTYRETAAAVYRSLAQRGGIALMTSSGGVVSGGKLTRQETLDRFAPEACAVKKPPVRDDIRVLVTTDLLSEGVNLQDASVVIHLDLPWTAARMEQRIGRVARLGSRHETVTSYALHPSERAEALIRVMGTVERKARVTQAVLGSEGAMSNASQPPGSTCVELAESVRSTLEQWLLPEISLGFAATTLDTVQVGAGSSRRTGAIVACLVDGRPELLVVDAGMRVSTDLVRVSTALTLSTDAELDASPALANRVLGALARWDQNRRAALDAGLDYCSTEDNHGRRTRAAIRQADITSAAQPFGDRGNWAERTSLLRIAASIPMPIALERLVYANSEDSFRNNDLCESAKNAARGRMNTDTGLAVVAMLLTGTTCHELPGVAKARHNE